MSSGFIWLAASTGLISLLTPCVFPMVPVTIAYFSGERRRADGARTAILFGLGIVSTFTILGLALAALFGASGLNRFAADPRVNIALAALFLMFAANLFGWFELNMPWRLLTAADRLSRETGQASSLGALIMGATFTLTSVTCTAPFVGTLLVLAATGSWITPIAGMLVYSTAFALPFVLLAFVPRAVANLPRAGDWMHTLRILIGLLEVAAAVKFISNADLVLHWGIFTRQIVLAIWTVIALSGALYLALHKAATTDRRFAPARLASVMVATLIALWLATGITGRTLPQVEAFLPPRAPVAVAPNSQSPQWVLNDYAGAVNTARSSGRLVFIDFTGYTCTNCRWMEANIFNRPDVGAQLNQFVLARLYTDGDGPIYEQQQAFQERTFGTVALPLYAVVDTDGKIRGTFSGLTRDPAEFVAFLRRAALGA